MKFLSETDRDKVWKHLKSKLPARNSMVVALAEAVVVEKKSANLDGFSVNVECNKLVVVTD